MNETAWKAGDNVLRIDVDGRLRECLVHLPPGFDPRRPLPLVLAFHGAGATGRLHAIATGWSEKADREGFAVAYPEGIREYPDRRATFLRNPPFFNVGSGIGYAEQVGVDDVRYVGRLLEELSRRMAVLPGFVFATGFSNGASMAFLTAMHYSEQVAAIAPVAGHLWRFRPVPRRPVAMLFIIGTRDPLNPLEGGTVRSPWGKLEPRPPVLRSVQTWVSWVGAQPVPEVVQDGPVRHTRWPAGPDGADVEMMLLDGAGHVWPGGPRVLDERISGPATDAIDATTVIWDFFRRHARKA